MEWISRKASPIGSLAVLLVEKSAPSARVSMRVSAPVWSAEPVGSGGEGSMPPGLALEMDARTHGLGTSILGKRLDHTGGAQTHARKVQHISLIIINKT